MKCKLLTICVTGYNIEKYIHKTLETFCDGRYEDLLEVLVVDDGSTDQTFYIAKEYEHKYPGIIKVIHQKNGGWGEAVNTGIRNATGKYFRILDGDDCFNKDSIDKLLDILNKNDVDAVYTAYKMIDYKTGDEVQYFSANKNIPRNEILPLSEMTKVTNEKVFVMPSSTYNMKMLQKNNINILNHCFYTDNEYNIKSMAFVRTIYITDILVYLYKVGRSSQSTSRDSMKARYKDHNRVSVAIMNFYQNIDLAKVNKNYIKGLIKLFLIEEYNNYISFNLKNEAKRFDKQLKSKYVEFYSLNKRINFFRKTNFNLIPLAYLYLKIREIISE